MLASLTLNNLPLLTTFNTSQSTKYRYKLIAEKFAT